MVGKHHELKESSRALTVVTSSTVFCAKLEIPTGDEES